jgi:hypothetical protein
MPCSRPTPPAAAMMGTPCEGGRLARTAAAVSAPDPRLHLTWGRCSRWLRGAAPAPRTGRHPRGRSGGEEIRPASASGNEACPLHLCVSMPPRAAAAATSAWPHRVRTGRARAVLQSPVGVNAVGAPRTPGYSCLVQSATAAACARPVSSASWRNDRPARYSVAMNSNSSARCSAVGLVTFIPRN